MTARNGLPCKKCGTSEWYRNGKCKECLRRWAQDNPGKNAKYKRRAREANPDKYRDRNRRWAQANVDQCVERARRWAQANPDKCKESARRWRLGNLDKRAAKEHRRRTRKTNAGGSYTAAEWEALCNHYGNKCLRCGRDSVKLTFDHVVPVSKGGTSDISNGQPLCGSCNSAKHDRHIDYRPDAGPLRWLQPALMSLQNA